MKQFIRTSRYFYSTALIVFGLQQFYFGTFRDVLFPAWQSSLPLLPVWAYIFGIFLITAGMAIIFEKRAKEVFLILGGIFLVFFLLAQIPYELFSQPNHIYHLGLWTNPLKELAYAGGAFVIAGTYKNENINLQNTNALFTILEKLIPFGSIFFCITMISFGIAHFMYADFVAKMVPVWFPDHPFWTYFAAVALIGSGICIVLNIRRKIMAFLLSLMIFLWFVMLHLPNAFANPTMDRGNELASAFDALLFSGTALAIAFGLKYQVGDKIL